MKVQQMIGTRGNPIANQFIITGENTNHYIESFQSYDSVIASKNTHKDAPYKVSVVLDEKYWDYSVTTSKYRNLFLGETKKETQRKIDSGEYQLVDLN